MKITLQQLLNEIKVVDKLITQIRENCVFPPKDPSILLPKFLKYGGQCQQSIEPYILAREKMINMARKIGAKMIMEGGTLSFYIANNNNMCVHMLNMRGIIEFNMSTLSLHLSGVDESEKEIINSWCIELNNPLEL